MNAADSRPTLIGYLPPPAGIKKTGGNYQYHSQFINIGDIVYAHAGAMLTSGRNFQAWDFRMTAEEVNERFSSVVFFIPCRIAPHPYDRDGYPYGFVTEFIEKLKIPFFSLGESIQAREYAYIPDFHKTLSPAVVRYLSVIADRSPVVGTRGNYSAEVLNGLGIKNAVPLGCPSLYLNGPSLPGSLLDVPTNPERVAVCYSNYQGNTHSRIDDFLRLASQHNYHYVEQVFGLLTQALYYPGKVRAADIYAARRFYKDMAPVLALLKQKRVRYFTNYSLWKDYLGTMDFAFGARMHGLTPALHAGKPAMFIAHDARVREMCEFFSLPFVAEHDLPASMDLDFFLSRCDYSATLPRYQEAYSRFVQTLRAHGLGGNIGPDGSIIDRWEPAPDLQVAREEGDPQYSSEEILNLEEQLAICAGIPDETFVKLAQVSDISQSWYLSRLK
ncbi:polysaccharide pyruvyl transferase family protein [Pseudomonas sp. WOUb67]|uniref:polysaccharide pyruvyl transferase family protein n=1 Tax=Pseudomonas sp. WOUb67 TaxID=3161136 RepID=UPI003CF00B74